MAHEICDTWGRVTPEEKHARKSMLFSIRLNYWHRPPYGDDLIRAAQAEFNASISEESPVSDAFALLSAEQRASLREAVQNPPVRVHMSGKEWWVEETLDLLDRLKRDEHVGPVTEEQLARAVGTKAV